MNIVFSGLLIAYGVLRFTVLRDYAASARPFILAGIYRRAMVGWLVLALCCGLVDAAIDLRARRAKRATCLFMRSHNHRQTGFRSRSNDNEVIRSSASAN